jgi:hypothetical protein
MKEAIKERSIIFSGPMVRSIISGTKTQTRRIINPQPPVHHWEHFKDSPLAEYQLRAAVHGNVGCWTPMMRKNGEEWRYDETACAVCPYGADTDQLWVREAFCLNNPEFEHQKPPTPRPSNGNRWPWYAATEPNVEGKNGKSPWKSSIHMPRWASRLLLTVISLRVERLQEITEDDAVAEGIDYNEERRLAGLYFYNGGGFWVKDARTAYSALWDKINGERANWASNPWVWVVSFKVLEGGKNG